MRSPLLVFTFLAAAACDAPAVEWGAPAVIPVVTAGRLVVDTAGGARFVAESAPAPAIDAPGACPGSVRVASGSRGLRAVWWTVRADSSAILHLAASADSGRTWGPHIVVDSLDVGRAGCGRPPPSVAAVGEDLHVAYSMIAPEGTGVFFAHFLGSMIHAPVAVIYGDRLVATAIAAEGDRVVVAYEDPNGRRRQVAIALSSTQGHLFERHLTASRDIDVATDPSVAIAGRQVAVSWTTEQASDSGTARVVRVGRIR